MQTYPDKFRFYLFIGVSLGLAIVSHRWIDENDVFFHLRIGEELLKNHQIILKDFWSFTAPGTLWYNHEWLSHVLLKWVTLPFSHPYDILPTLRSVLALILSFLLLSLAVQSQSRKSALLFSSLVLVPAIYSSIWFELRPEAFAFLFFAFSIQTWINPNNTPRRLLFTSFLTLLLWANFHSGTVPFGIFFISLAILFDSRLSALNLFLRLRLCILCAAIWLCTPIGIQGVIKSLGILNDPLVVFNPDLAGFRLRLLDPTYAGFRWWLWLILTGASPVTYYFLKKHRSTALPGPYQSTLFFSLGFSSLTFMAFWMVRTRFYPLVFMLPVLSAGITELFERLSRRSDQIEKWVVVLPSILISSIVAYHSTFIDPPLGFGISRYKFPVLSTKFISLFKPKRNLLNNMNFGCYLIDQLRDYPIATATSGETFHHRFLPELVEAMKSPGTYRTLLDKYEINLVLDSLPEYLIENGQVQNPQSDFFPKSEWALVFFDDASVLYLRRIPENQDLIKKYEYHLLYRQFPADIVANSNKISSQYKQAYEAELDRCLQQQPENTFCLSGKELFVSNRKLGK